MHRSRRIFRVSRFKHAVLYRDLKKGLISPIWYTVLVFLVSHRGLPAYAFLMAPHPQKTYRNSDTKSVAKTNKCLKMLNQKKNLFDGGRPTPKSVHDTHTCTMAVGEIVK